MSRRNTKGNAGRAYVKCGACDPSRGRARRRRLRRASSRRRAAPRDDARLERSTRRSLRAAVSARDADAARPLVVRLRQPPRAAPLGARRRRCRRRLHGGAAAHDRGGVECGLRHALRPPVWWAARGQAGRAAYIGAAEACAALTQLRLDAAVVEVVRKVGAGAAVHAVASTAFAAGAARGGTRCPIILQHDGHSRSIVGATSSADTVLIADPNNNQAVSVVRVPELDGRQYQMTFLVGEPSRRLGDAEAQRRRGEFSEALRCAGTRAGSTTAELAPSCASAEFSN